MRNGQTLVSRKTGEETAKIVVLRKDIARLRSLSSNRTWETKRENIAKSYEVSRTEV